MDACLDCRTTAGCERHGNFSCETCGRITSWSDGAADDRPDDCSTCWKSWYEPRRQFAEGLARLLGAGSK